MRSSKVFFGLLFSAMIATGAIAQTVRVVGNNAYLPISQYNPNLPTFQGVQQVMSTSGQPVTVDFTTRITATASEYVYPIVGGPGAAIPGTPGAAAAVAVSEPEIDIMEAAGTLTDPTAFIYLSQEFVFDLLVLGSRLGVQGIQFDPSLLPTPPPPAGTVGTLGYGGYGGGYSYGDEEYYGQAPVVAQAPQPAEVDKTGWLDAVSVSQNENLEKLLEMVQDLPDSQRVARLPLLTTEKESIDKEIIGIYVAAFNQIGPQAQSRAAYYTGASPWMYEGEEDYYDEEYYSPAPVAATPSTPPVDPQAMAEWYYFYQQMIGWERFVSEETLKFQEDENASRYDLDTALGPQDLYLIPSPDGSPQLIRFDQKETEMTPYLSLVRPGALDTALSQMKRVMEDWAEKRAKEDSDRSRNYVVRLDVRQERRFRYRDWLNDQATEIRKMAEDYRKRLAGEHIEIEGMEILLTKEKLINVPVKARNIVTERLTPYDLLDAEGKIIRPPDDATEPLL